MTERQDGAPDAGPEMAETMRARWTAGLCPCCGMGLGSGSLGVGEGVLICGWCVKEGHDKIDGYTPLLLDAILTGATVAEVSMSLARHQGLAARAAPPC